MCKYTFSIAMFELFSLITDLKSIPFIIFFKTDIRKDSEFISHCNEINKYKTLLKNKVRSKSVDNNQNHSTVMDWDQDTIRNKKKTRKSKVSDLNTIKTLLCPIMHVLCQPRNTSWILVRNTCIKLLKLKKKPIVST